MFTERKRTRLYLLIHISPQFSENSLINSNYLEVCSICSFIITKHRGRVKEEEKEKEVAKRFRFNLGWRKTAPLVVEGEDWSRPDLAILQEVK